MAVTWTTDHEKRLMTVVADGNVTRGEMDAVLDALEIEGIMTYRRLFDGTNADTDMGPDNILQLGIRMRGYHQTAGRMGPLAVVAPVDKLPLIERVIGMLAIADRPMKVFTERTPAEEWVVEQPLVRPPTKKTVRGPGRPPRLSKAG